MKRRLLLVLSVLFASSVTFGQLSGTYTIPGAPYATIAAAISALNTQGVGAGGVTFNITSGHTETFPSITAGLITATGTSANPIVFQKNGAGANPLITAGTPGTGSYDYVICFGGSDYVTFNGIDIQENAANTTTTQQMEWAYAVLKSSATDGSQYVTVKNCNISLNQANTATYGIYSNNRAYTAPGTTLTITSLSGTNSNNKFFGNTFTNIFNGIYLYGYADASPYAYYDQNNEIGKDGANTFTALGGLTTTAYGIYGYYQNGFKMANNTFNGTTTSTTGSLYCMYLPTGVNSSYDIYNNTISVTYNGTGSLYGIYSLMGASGTSNVTNIYNNTVTNCSFPNMTSGTFYGLYMYGGMTDNFYNNQVTNNTIGSATATATGSFYGIYHYCSPTNAGTSNVYGNTVANNSRIQSTIGTGTGYHFYMSGGNGTMNMYNNIVNNQTVGSSSTQYIGYILYSGVKYFYNNTITNILNSNGGTLYGIYNGNGTGNAYFYNNKIQNINGNATGSIVYGVYQSSGANIYYYNNFISELKAPAATGAMAVAGMYLTGGTSIGAFNNTIYLNAASTGAAFGSVGIYASTTPVIDLRANIVVNMSTPGATGYSVGLRYSGTSLTNFAATSNYNDYYAGTPGANNLIFYDGTNMDQTLSAFKTRVAPRESTSVTENPPFVNVATMPYDLHMKTTVATQTESGALVISTPANITTDYDNNPRFPNAGYPVTPPYTPIAPDMGADEFGGIPLDLNPPNSQFTPFMNTNLLTARVLTTTITDQTGVPTSGAGLPRLYWRINSGSWTGVTGTFVSGNTYTFTFGAGVVLNDVVSYYIVAQDMVTPTPNVGSNPSAGASGFTINPPACSTPPTTPYTYTIVGTLCGTKTVGTGGDYVNLTAAVSAVNNSVLTCPVILQLLSTYSSAGETFPIVINPNPGSSTTNTLTIKPNTGVTATITGASASGPMIKILNPNTIIDGSNTTNGTTRDLTISNTSTTTPQVLVVGSTGATPITNVTLKNNVFINGINSSSAVIISDGTTAGNPGYYNNITVQNNSFQLAYIALYCNAMMASGNGNGLLITGNHFNTAGANSVRLVGIYIQGVDGATVTNNTIGNMNNTVDASNMTGIWFATGTINSVISGNTINGLSSTTTAPRGIAISSAQTNSNITVIGNTITNITTSYSSAPYGIYLFSTTTGIMVKNNTVGVLLNSNTGGYGARGIHAVTNIANSNINIINNLVYDIKCSGDASLTYYLIGIGVEGTTGGVNIYHNSVNISGTYAGYTSATVATALYLGTGAAAIDVRDNILVNTYDNTGSTSDKSYAVYCGTTNAAFAPINYNDYYVSGTPGVLGYLTADVTTFAGWQTATGQDANSKNIDPLFVSATDLHAGAAGIQKAGQFLAAAPTDFTGVNRTSPPDMGAYQTSANQVVTTTAATAIASATATLNGTITANNSTVTSGFEYGLTTAYGTAVAGVPPTVGGTATTNISANIIGLAPSTLYHYRATGVSGAVNGVGLDMTFTTTAAPPTVVTTAATGVTANTATLNGTVNANGASTTVSFDYGLTTAYGTNIPGVPVTVTGNTVTACLANITGLLPATLYHYRINGTNTGGTANGLDMTFTTPAAAPTAITTAATNVLTTTATLNGTINANGASTTTTFEYGITVAYGSTIAGTPGTVTGNTTTPVSANVTGLLIGQTYHYRIKGVNSMGTTNGNDMTFTTGCQAAGPAGNITGPSQVCQGGSGYVYSVAPIANATGYAWTLPTGGTITSGANTNSITVSYSAVAVSGYVSVNGTSVCGNGAASQLPVNVNSPTTPTLTGASTVCANSTGNVYTTQTGMSSYVWIVVGGTITSGGTSTSNTATVTWTAPGVQSISVNFTNAAGCVVPTATVKNVTVNPAPTPTITGPSTGCTGNSVTYSTQTGQIGYNWTVSAGGTITAGAGTSTITVTWVATGAQSVSVNYSNSSGCSAPTPVVYNVTVSQGVSPTITGNNNLCVGSGYYNYTTQAGFLNYVWTISSGGTITAGQGTNVIQVIWNSPGIQWVAVNYSNASGCSAIAPVQYSVTVNGVPGNAGTITGTPAICGGSTGIAYSVDPVANATTYIWTLPAGATIASGANTNAITVDFASNASAGNITVQPNSLCGNGNTSPPYAVTVTPLPADAGPVTGQTAVCVPVMGVAYSIVPIPNATGYNWTLPAGATIVSGANTNAIMVDFGVNALPGDITVLGTNTCGEGNSSPALAIAVHPTPPLPTIYANGVTLTSSAPAGNQWYYEGTMIPGATGQVHVAQNTGFYWVKVTLDGCASDTSIHEYVVMVGIQPLLSTSFTVSPVPNDGKFKVKITSPVTDIFSIIIYNELGVSVYEQKNVEVSGTLEKAIDLTPVAPGIYSILFRNASGQVVKKMIINR